MLLFHTSIPNHVPKSGKVRDVYDFGDTLLLVSTDRISAFDWVLPTGIPDKGRVLNTMSAFWFNTLGVKNHLLTTDVNAMPQLIQALPVKDREYLLAQFAGRSSLARKCQIFPIECIVRGYLSGSGWAEYKKSQTVCGIKLPAGLKESSKLPQPIFTPSTKAEEGHDENIPFERAAEMVGQDTAEKLREFSLDVFRRGAEFALKKGIIIADTKFEFGLLDGEIILADEVLTPDSSRFWSVETYQPDKSQPSLDKQFVRDYLTSTGWDKNSPPPELPPEVIEKTRQKYLEALTILTQ